MRSKMSGRRRARTSRFLKRSPASRPLPKHLGKVSLMVDMQLMDRARSALERSPHLANKRLKLEARQGRLILRGTVASYYQKQMAQETLRKLDGVEEIENHLQVHWH